MGRNIDAGLTACGRIGVCEFPRCDKHRALIVHALRCVLCEARPFSIRPRGYRRPNRRGYRTIEAALQNSRNTRFKPISCGFFELVTLSRSPSIHRDT
jgi:hypothetical protein